MIAHEYCPIPKGKMPEYCRLDACRCAFIIMELEYVISDRMAIIASLIAAFIAGVMIGIIGVGPK